MAQDALSAEGVAVDSVSAGVYIHTPRSNLGTYRHIILLFRLFDGIVSLSVLSQTDHVTPADMTMFV